MTATSEAAAVTPESFAPTAGKRWYVVHAYSGMEKAVERNLRERIDRSEVQEKFGRILVPMEEVVELKNGKKSVTERRMNLTAGGLKLSSRQGDRDCGAAQSRPGGNDAAPQERCSLNDRDWFVILQARPAGAFAAAGEQR